MARNVAQLQTLWTPSSPGDSPPAGWACNAHHLDSYAALLAARTGIRCRVRTRAGTARPPWPLGTRCSSSARTNSGPPGPFAIGPTMTSRNCCGPTGGISPVGGVPPDHRRPAAAPGPESLGVRGLGTGTACRSGPASSSADRSPQRDHRARSRRRRRPRLRGPSPHRPLDPPGPGRRGVDSPAATTAPARSWPLGSRHTPLGAPSDSRASPSTLGSEAEAWAGRSPRRSWIAVWNDPDRHLRRRWGQPRGPRSLPSHWLPSRPRTRQRPCSRGPLTWHGGPTIRRRSPCMKTPLHRRGVSRPAPAATDTAAPATAVRPRPGHPRRDGRQRPGHQPRATLRCRVCCVLPPALHAVARRTGADVRDPSVGSRVRIGPNDAGGYQLAVDLEVTLPHLDTGPHSPRRPGSPGLSLLQRHQGQHRGHGDRPRRPTAVAGLVGESPPWEPWTPDHDGRGHRSMATTPTSPSMNPPSTMPWRMVGRAARRRTGPHRGRVRRLPRNHGRWLRPTARPDRDRERRTLDR